MAPGRARLTTSEHPARLTRLANSLTPHRRRQQVCVQELLLRVWILQNVLQSLSLKNETEPLPHYLAVHTLGSRSCFKPPVWPDV